MHSQIHAVEPIVASKGAIGDAPSHPHKVGRAGNMSIKGYGNRRGTIA